MSNFSQFLLLLLFLNESCFGAEKHILRVATINIWNGGSHSPQGLVKFAPHIGQINPDIVALQIEECQKIASNESFPIQSHWQEVYGNGAERLAELLNKWELSANGHHRQNEWTAAARPCKRYTDTALLTRHKFVEFADDGCELWGNGAKIELIGKGQQRMVNVFGMHLDYVNYGPDAVNNGMKLQQILSNEQVRVKNIRQLFALPQFQRWNHSSKFGAEPLLVLGDMNTPSHEDWTEATSKLHNGQTVPWPTTKLLKEEGQFEDAFRIVHPRVAEYPGITWPFPQQTMPSGDRIDFVFFKGTQMKPINSFLHPPPPLSPSNWHEGWQQKKYSPKAKKKHGISAVFPPPLNPSDSPVEWPSDHFGLVVDFLLN